ncbi:MAG: ABC-F family ATP-binding cassette domain-containing protein [Lachnospiraceae bacterium]|nr:ABC-F family ATP-binding cassette domain-containing protein [Lachnospiraceae bacterium]
MILSCSHICKAFVEKDVLKDVSFHIENHEKAAIVGINGAGKSTLLKILIGELAPDSGEVILAKGASIGYLAQYQNVNIDSTIIDTLFDAKPEIGQLESRIRRLELEMKHSSGDELDGLMNSYSNAVHEFELKGGYAYKSEITGILKGLGFTEEEFDKKISELSGGQKTRVFLGKLLISKPDIILLDEPTNHLDISSVTWLENYLLNYKGSVLIVTHDRFFLDRVVTKVIEIENCTAIMYAGNYTAFAAKKAQLFEARMKQYLNQQAEIKHQEDVITKLRSFNREKSIKRAESREKALAKINIIDKPMTPADAMRMKLEPCIQSGNDVLTVKDVSKAFGANRLFENISFEIKRGERVAIIGGNGTGKTTMLKIITQALESDTGSIKLGSRVKIGYYDQEHQVLHMDKTLFDELQDEYPDMNNTQIRNVLAAFLFTGEDVFKRIRDLSGGERGRVSLAKLMLSESNFLILDEPTNHLDMTSKEILENAIANYTGTVLYVSHDRYFINKTATRILELTNRTFVNYIGNYDYYLEKKELLAPKAADPASVSANRQITENKSDWQAKKEQQARERKRISDLSKTEQEINSLEERNAEIDELLTHDDIAVNVSRLMELNDEKTALEARLEELYLKWEELAQ